MQENNNIKQYADTTRERVNELTRCVQKLIENDYTIIDVRMAWDLIKNTQIKLKESIE